MRGSDSEETGERTMMIKAPTFAKSGRGWRSFRFEGLPKVSKAHAHLLRNLEWMLPNVRATGEVSESVAGRLKQMLEESVSISADSMQIVPPQELKRYVSDPTFLAVLAPQPNKTRGLLEVELGLAHVAIDMLLGGTGEAVALRPLTDIEEGVLTYLIIETLKALAPSLDASLPKLRIEGLAKNFAEASALVGDRENLAVVQLTARFGAHSGYLRLFIPESVLSSAAPPADSEVRRARFRSDAAQFGGRLQHAQAWLRAEIGRVEISSSDLMQLRERDVVLVDGLSCRPDHGAEGSARVFVGMGRTGFLDAAVAVQDGRYVATIQAVTLGSPRPPGGPMDDVGEELPPEEGEAAQGVSEDDDEMTNPAGVSVRGDMENSAEGSDLLNDVPLQVSVELGRVAVSAEEVVGLKVGHVFDLNRVAGEPLDLSVNGKVVARGELVEIEGNLGVRILSLAG